MEYTLNIRGRLLDLSTPKVMGILNATPDSFYSGSRKQTEKEIAEQLTVEQKRAGKATQNHRHKNTPINPFLTKGTPRSGGAPFILNVNA